MGYFSELDAEGPYRTCGEADEARRFYPEEYAMATAPVTTRACLFCGKAGYPSACPECMTWDAPGEAPAIDDVAPGSPPETEPSEGRCVNWNSGVLS